jgi:tryptophanyl-tRNA synthetase
VQINRHAFTGGGATLEEHRAKGANLEVDVPWKYLNFFEEDDAKLEHIGKEYGAGRMLTGEVAPDPPSAICCVCAACSCIWVGAGTPGGAV